MIELVGRSDSDGARHSSTRQSATGNQCNAQGVLLCDKGLKQTATSLSSCEAEFYAASACARERWVLQNLSKNFIPEFQFD